MNAAVAIAGAMVGVVLLRVGWGGRRVWVWLGWAAIAVAAVGLASVGGAWGIAVVGVAAIIAAALVLTREALATAPKRAVAPRDAPAIALPRPTVRAVARRIAVFLLVVPIGLGASVLLALGGEAVAARAGWAEADRTALALFATPVAWSVLATIQMTRATTARMIAPAGACALAGALLWWPL